MREVVALRLREVTGELKGLPEKWSSLEMMVGEGQRIVSKGLENAWREGRVSGFSNGSRVMLESKGSYLENWGDTKCSCQSWRLVWRCIGETRDALWSMFPALER